MNMRCVPPRDLAFTGARREARAARMMHRSRLLPVLLALFAGCSREPSTPSATPASFEDHTTAEHFHLDLPPLQFRGDPARLEMPGLATPPLHVTPADLARRFLLTEQELTGGTDDDRQQLETSLATIDPATLHRQPPELIKQAALDVLRPRLGPGDLPARYNAASASLAVVQRHGSWQCNTGTSLFFLSALRLPADAFRGQHFVLIYERGHVLPGYLRRRDDGWHLFGVEMTVLGAGQKRYGAVATLAEAGYALRIVQAPEALAVQAVGPYVSNGNELATHVLRRTAARYGIPLADLERNIRDSLALRANATAAAGGAGDPPPALVAPWAFGAGNVPPGDRPMMKRDWLNPRNNQLSFTEVLALLPPDANNDDPEAPVIAVDLTGPDNLIAPGRAHPPVVEESPEESDGDSPPKRLVYPWDSDYPAPKN